LEGIEEHLEQHSIYLDYCRNAVLIACFFYLSCYTSVMYNEAFGLGHERIKNEATKRKANKSYETVFYYHPAHGIL